jgi:hypothetical protein
LYYLPLVGAQAGELALKGKAPLTIHSYLLSLYVAKAKLDDNQV